MVSKIFFNGNSEKVILKAIFRMPELVVGKLRGTLLRTE